MDALLDQSGSGRVLCPSRAANQPHPVGPLQQHPDGEGVLLAIAPRSPLTHGLQRAGDAGERQFGIGLAHPRDNRQQAIVKRAARRRIQHHLRQQAVADITVGGALQPLDRPGLSGPDGDEACQIAPGLVRTVPAHQEEPGLDRDLQLPEIALVEGQLQLADGLAVA